METIINEKTYPIQNRWIWKAALINWGLIIYMGFLLFYLIIRYSDQIIGYFILFAVLYFGNIILSVLRKNNFYYSFDEQHLSIRQGIISKQQRFIPYEVIQHVLVKQDFLDRIFGLAALSIENAAMSGGANAVPNQYQKYDTVGSSGNQFSIPGLNKSQAEELKTIVLQKMKEHPTRDITAGL